MEYFSVTQRQQIGIDVAARAVAIEKFDRDTMYGAVNRSLQHAYKPEHPTQLKVILAIETEMSALRSSDGFLQARDMMETLQRDAFTAVQLGAHGVHPHKSAKNDLLAERAIRAESEHGREGHSTIPEPVRVWVEESGRRIADILMAEHDARIARKDDAGDYSMLLAANLTLQPLYRAMLADDPTLLNAEDATCPWSATIEDHLLQIRSGIMQVCMERLMLTQGDIDAWYADMYSGIRNARNMNENKFSYSQKDWFAESPFPLSISAQEARVMHGMRAEIVSRFRKLQTYTRNMMAVAVREAKIVMPHALQAVMKRNEMQELAKRIAPLALRYQEDAEGDVQLPAGDILYGELLGGESRVSLFSHDGGTVSVLSVQSGADQGGISILPSGKSLEHPLSCTFRQMENGQELIPGRDRLSIRALPKSDMQAFSLFGAADYLKQKIHHVWLQQPELAQISGTKGPIGILYGNTHVTVTFPQHAVDEVSCLFPDAEMRPCHMETLIASGLPDTYKQTELMEIKIALSEFDSSYELVETMVSEVPMQPADQKYRTLAPYFHSQLHGRYPNFKEYDHALRKVGVEIISGGRHIHLKSAHGMSVRSRSDEKVSEGVDFRQMAMEITRLKVDPDIFIDTLLHGRRLTEVPEPQHV